MARIDFEPRWMASRIAVVIVGIGTIAPSDRDRGGRGKRKRIPRERMTFRPTAWRRGATRAGRGEGKNKSTTCAREWCFNSAADWSNYWRNIAIITSLSLCPSASPVCLRHVLKMITICIYTYIGYTWYVCTSGLLAKPPIGGAHRKSLCRMPPIKRSWTGGNRFKSSGPIWR